MPGLRETLGNMIAAAERDKTKATRVRLPKGLTVAMKVTAEGDLALQLSRADVYPALAEWKTVLNALPQSTVLESPRPMLANHVYYLKGKVKLTQELLQ